MVSAYERATKVQVLLTFNRILNLKHLKHHVVVVAMMV